MNSKKLLIVVNDPKFFLSHRLPVALKAKAEGYDVHVATADGAAVQQILSAGLLHHVLPISRSGRAVLKELNTIVQIFRLFISLKPSIVHLVTIKPVIYGGIAARLASTPAIVYAISGLGYVYTEQGFKARIRRWFISTLYSICLSHRNCCVIFQNDDDRRSLMSVCDLNNSQTVLIKGSGVDLASYSYVPEPNDGVVVMMACRLLREKGVVEYVKSARQILAEDSSIRFILVGEPDQGNPNSITQEEFDLWKKEGLVECLGHRDDIADLMKLSSIVVLPSYYGEGLPKVLIEAAACGRAVVTTDNTGCRDAVIDNETGILVPVRNVDQLTKAIKRLIGDKNLRERLGKAGRKLAEKEFSIERVVDNHIAVYQGLEGHV